MFDQDIQTPRNLFKNLSFASVFDKLLGVWISWWNTLPRVWYHVIYCFYHSKIKSISSRHCVISSIIYLLIRFKFLQGKQLSGVMLTTFPLAICSSLVAKQCRCDDTSVVDLMWNRVSYGIAAIGVRAQIYRGGAVPSPKPKKAWSKHRSNQCTEGFRKHYLYNMAYFKSIYVFLWLYELPSLRSLLPDFTYSLRQLGVPPPMPMIAASYATSSVYVNMMQAKCMKLRLLALHHASIRCHLIRCPLHGISVNYNYYVMGMYHVAYWAGCMPHQETFINLDWKKITHTLFHKCHLGP